MTPKGTAAAKKAEKEQPALFTESDAAFEKEFTRLNPAQRKAVETIDGPVMCIAGPGTGKTQVVALRVANILRRTQMRPGNILCLTFSNSGATAMRERLRKLIGADAYGVGVDTIHGFCNEIIRRNPHVFEQWSTLEQVTDIERYRIVNTIIDRNIENFRIINKKNPYQRTKDIIDRISLFKREAKSLQDLHRVAEAYDREMEGKSRAGTKAHEKNLLSARKFHELIEIYEAYQEALKTTQRYDYEDMILTVIAALEENDWLLANLQERYQYVLVDEFQDTNGAQARLIERLTTVPEATGDPNLFIVGDDDQAIYRFQGANLQNILGFTRRFPKAPLVVLDISYRCSQSILDAAGKLIAYNTERLVGTVEGLRKDLTSAKGPGGQSPTLVYAPSDETEPWMIADMITSAVDAGTPLSEIAVLVQKNSELPIIYNVLRSKEIPVELRGKIDLLDHDTVRQAISLLRAVASPYDSGVLAAGVSVETLGCAPADLGRLYVRRRQDAVSLHDLLLKTEVDGASWGLSKPETVIAARDLILDLHQKLDSRSLLTTVERMLRLSGLLSFDGRSQDPIQLVALQGFFHWIERRCLEQPGITLKILMSDLDAYANPDYGDLRLTYAFPHMISEGVQLMTAHQSKGLEFDVVILANFREGHWNARRTPSSLSIPEELLFGWASEQKDFERNQDERRVCYVAMTRARNTLLFTCPRQLVVGQKTKDVSPSAFFAESGTLPETDGALKNGEKCSRLLTLSPRDIDEEFATYLRERVEQFVLSPSALNHFLKDPQYFLAIDLLQMPEEKKPALLYGNAVHSAMAKWGSSVKEGLPIGLPEFQRTFEEYILEREVFSEKERIGLLSAGKESLERYYHARMTQNLPIVHSVEHMVRAHLEGIPLKGHIDRIDLDHPEGSAVTVIDFKTGRTKTMGQIRSEDAEESLWNPDGDNYRQLVFYSLVMELGEPLLKPKLFVLDFIGDADQEPIQRALSITPEERAMLVRMIKQVWQKIQNLDFTPIERS